MRLEPKVTPAIMRFLEPTIKLRPIDWEPRYNLIPVTVSEIQTVRHTQTPEKPVGQERPGQSRGGSQAQGSRCGRETWRSGREEKARVGTTVLTKSSSHRVRNG